MTPKRITTVLFALMLSTNTAFAQSAETEAPAEGDVAEDASNAQAPASADDLSAPVDLDSFTNERVLGEADAPLAIVEYASFTCPHCDRFHAEVYPLLKENYIDNGKAKLIYREVYFDGAGLLAASLARCVPENQYFSMVSALYETDENWLRSQDSIEGLVQELTKLGVMAGLPKDKIAACLDNREAQELMIANSQVMMDKDNVKGTPTVIVNGEAVDSWAWDDLQPFLDAEFEKAQ